MSLVFDTFTDGDETELESHVGEVGAAWSVAPGEASGAGRIIGNRLYGFAGAGGYIASATPTSVEYSVEAVLTWIGYSGNWSAGPAARIDYLSAPTSYYRTACNPNDGTVRLWKVIAGNLIELGSASLSGGDGDVTIRLECKDATKTVYADENEVIVSVDNEITDAGRPGVVVTGESSTTGWHIDTLTVNEIVLDQIEDYQGFGNLPMLAPFFGPWSRTGTGFWVPSAVAGFRSISMGQVTETDSAFAITPRNIRAVRQTLETDTAQAFGRQKLRTFGQTTEIDISQTIRAIHSRILGLPSESDISQSFAKRKIKSIGQPIETDAAQSITSFLAHVMNQTVETDISQTFVGRKVRALGQSSETNTSQTFRRIKTRVLGQPSETDTAQFVKVPLRVNIITETDTAQSILRIKRKTLGQPAETDTTQPLSHRKLRLMNICVETDISQGITRIHRRTLGEPSETNSSRAMRVGHAATINTAFETDLARDITTIGVNLNLYPRELGQFIRGNDTRVVIRGSGPGRIVKGGQPRGRVHSGSRGKIRGGS